jgi:hypothetical protein
LIVVSGVLVLVALVFLVIGLLGDGLGFIWASIITSVIAGVFLLLGALQRRGAPVPAADAGPAGADTAERVTAVNVRPREEAASAAAEPAAALVSVVPGRPRYHVESCRFLTGRPDVEQVGVDQARTEGYTACGVCKPDAALEAAAAAAPPATPEAEPEPDAEVTTLLEPAPAKKAPAKKAAAATRSTAAATATAEPAAPAKKAAAKTAVAAKAPAKAATGAQVVVIPDRGKFHIETCRFVKDVPGTLTISKANAKRQGYTACGVCKP